MKKPETHCEILFSFRKWGVKNHVFQMKSGKKLKSFLKKPVEISTFFEKMSFFVFFLVLSTSVLKKKVKFWQKNQTYFY